jgi:hypothetical protein
MLDREHLGDVRRRQFLRDGCHRRPGTATRIGMPPESC